MFVMAIILLYIKREDNIYLLPFYRHHDINLDKTFWENRERYTIERFLAESNAFISL